MPWVTEAEIQAAREMTAIEYLRKYEPNRLKKSTARNEWELTDHDSFKINGITSKWHWKSRDIGGTSALNFLVKVEGMAFPEAVQLLSGENPSYIPPEHPPREIRPFMLPDKNDNSRRILQYLSGRGISDNAIRYCLRLGILYESRPYHNVVFVGRDEGGKARYAFLRGIYDKDGKAFKIEQSGSEKSYAFCIPPVESTRRVAVYEACIDALAHLSLEGRADKYRLELGGISAPREGETRREMKKPAALEHFLKQHPEIEEIEICTDNDFAGRWACAHIRQAYEKNYRIIENLPQIEGADYADLAKWKKEEKQKTYTMPEKGR